MPELPEVETVKRTLIPRITGKKITDVVINYETMIKGISAEEFKNNLTGQHFLNIMRRGKYLIFELDDYYLLSHLRMEGKFFYGESEFSREKHTHVEFKLEDEGSLKYEDVRKFGTFHLYAKGINLETTPSFKVLGLEPWDEVFDFVYVKNFLKGKKMPIKSMLLSQKLVTGLGNIYVDEVLFASKIHPLKISGELTDGEIHNIIEHTQTILAKAIEYKGTTIKTFTSSHGMTGEFQNFLKVHTKYGDKCQDCQAIIVKTKVGGRGTYFCPVCQKN